MTLGCTRCGNTMEADSITNVNTYEFPHASGCGAGIGPIFILPDGNKAIKNPKPKEDEVEFKPVVSVSHDIIETDEVKETKPKRNTPKHN